LGDHRDDVSSVCGVEVASKVELLDDRCAR
jgi:hypothetical protein